MRDFLNYGPWIIAIEVAALLLLVILGYMVWRYRRFLKEINQAKPNDTKKNVSIQDLINRAKREKSKTPLNIMLGSGAFAVEDEIKINSPIRMVGNGIEETKIVAKGDHPAISITNTDNCFLDNIRIEGAIHCTNGKVFLNNCQVVAKDEGICIEANDGSVVTFSGLIRGEGGIAIRAKGESRVILKPPYVVSGDDFIVMDPKSRLAIEDQKKDRAPSEKA